MMGIKMIQDRNVALSALGNTKESRPIDVFFAIPLAPARFSRWGISIHCKMLQAVVNRLESSCSKKCDEPSIHCRWRTPVLPNNPKNGSVYWQCFLSDALFYNIPTHRSSLRIQCDAYIRVAPRVTQSWPPSPLPKACHKRIAASTAWHVCIMLA